MKNVKKTGQKLVFSHFIRNFVANNNNTNGTKPKKSSHNYYQNHVDAADFDSPCRLQI